ncbi:substrate-binding domain-containing protein [Streptomyces sp. NPDC056390]|uniref:LacI family DNA-binding transcriptional regulator n=1 Tax=Streptomyces sp. NPDC056390 TaxID=3345806 RepID=UPI0035D8B2F4
MKDVARAAGVSQATVSYVYSNSGRVSEAQREHVYAVAAQLGYVGPNAVGASLRSGRVGAVGVVVMDSVVDALEDPSTILLMKGIAEVGDLEEVALTLLSAGEDVRTSKALRGLVDGIVLHNMPEEHPLAGALAASGIPAVAVDSPRGSGLPYVGIDDQRGARLQMEHLLALGHRRVGILVDKLWVRGDGGLVSLAEARTATERNARERLAGHFKAWREAGLDLSDLRIVDAAGIDDAAGARAASLLFNAGEVTAVVALSDVHAAAAMWVARERGLSVPQDVSVIGYDDAPLAALTDLSTIHQPIVEKGRQAATMLLDRIAGGNRKRTLLRTRLVERGSTAAPRQ